MSQATIEAIHAAPLRLSLCIAGAGAAAVSALTSVAGCSRTLMHAEVLYVRAATVRALDYSPTHIVSQTVARQLAQRACRCALRLRREEASARNDGDDDNNNSNSNGTCASLLAHADTSSTTTIIGVGATSAVHTSRQRHGADEAYVSVWNARVRRVRDYHVVLPKHWERGAQDDKVTALILHAIAHEAAHAVAFAARGGGGGEVSRASCCRHGVVVDDHVSTTAQLRSALGLPSDVLCHADDVPWLPHTVASHTTNENDDNNNGSDDDDDSEEGERRVHEALVQRVLDGQLPCVLWNRHGDVRAADTPYGGECTVHTTSSSSLPLPQQQQQHYSHRPLRLLYPGSFRPLHWGHTELARAAAAAMMAKRVSSSSSNGNDNVSSNAIDTAVAGSDVQVTYEVASAIVDKAAVTARELYDRVRQFLIRGERVAVTSATLFVQKAALFEHHGLVVGLDTARRVLDPRYYTPSTTAGMVAALRRDIAQHGCYFVVGGRRDGDVWRDAHTLHVPEELRDLFVALAERQFRVDVSSTELRARAAAFAASAAVHDDE